MKSEGMIRRSVTRTGEEGGWEKERTITLSQIPCVSFARVLAEQGAMRTRSAHLRN